MSCLTALVSPQMIFAQSVLPENPEVISGDIAFHLPGPDTLDVVQTSDAGIINWDTFSIGEDNVVSFDNGEGATLNRVVGGNLSEIFGTLEATGSLYLINENGIIFGENGSVRTGFDFIASSLDIDNADFLAGKDVIFSSDSDAYVINYGSLFSEAGDIALISRTVTNEGSIFAPQGSAAMIAGREVLMRDANLDDGRFLVRIGGDDTSVTEDGIIRAAEVELRTNGGNIYALAGNTDGVVHATGVSRQKDGRIFLTAGAGGKVNVAKTIKSTNRAGNGGAIRVTGDYVDVSGTLDSSSMPGTGGTVHILAGIEAVFTGRILAFGSRDEGTGGFAEVSGERSLKYNGGHIDTGNGVALLDPDNIEIQEFTVSSGGSILDDASVILDTDIYALLVSNEVIIQTSGVDAEAGTILVNTDLIYNSTNNLSLLAHGDIILDGSIQNSNATSGDINLVAGWSGTTSTLSFNSADFDVADVSTATNFGNNSGTAYTFFGGETSEVASGTIDMSSFNEVRVGSRSGATRLYANDIFAESQGSDLQIGFFAQNQGAAYSITGDIELNAVGDIMIMGEQTDSGGASQVGHVGSIAFGSPDTTVDASVNADISVRSGGLVTVAGGQGYFVSDYGQIGHGGYDIYGDFTGLIDIQSGGGVDLLSSFEFASYSQIGHGDNSESGIGNHQGDITIDTDGEISIESSNRISTIGHKTGTGGNIANADVTLVATAFDESASSSVASGARGSIDPKLIEDAIVGGDLSIQVTDSGIVLTDRASYNSTNQLLITASDDFVLSQPGESLGGITNLGSGDIILSAGSVFENDSFTNTPIVATSGRWLVYSERPDLNSQDLEITNRDFLAYGITFDAAIPINASLPTGSGLVYQVSPVVTFTANDQQITYGDDIDTTDAVGSLTVGGTVVAEADFGIDLSIYDPTVSLGSGVTFSSGGYANAGLYEDGLSTSVAASSATIMGVTTASVAGNLDIQQYEINVMVGADDKEFDGTVAAVITGSSDDVLTGDSVSFSGTGEFDDSEIGDDKDVTILDVMVDGADSANYLIGETRILTMASILPRTSVIRPLDATPEGTPTTTAALDPVPGPIITEMEILSDLATDTIVQDLSQGNSFCRQIAQKEYVVDCMSDRLAEAAASLPNTGAYAETKAALETASRKLAALARQNASDALPPKRVRTRSLTGPVSSRKLVPVQNATSASVLAQARAIIQEAETVLLRSAENSDRRKVHYQRIAKAVGSNKVLLRSI